MRYKKGSEWRKWDLHVHTPESVLENSFPNDWDEYVSQLFKLAIAKEIFAIGITDYNTIDGYSKLKTEYLNNPEKLNELFTEDEIQYINQMLVIPNIEFRINKLVIGKESDLSWNRRVNYHLLLSDDISVEDIRENLLHRLHFEHEGLPDGASQKRSLTRRNIEELGQLLKIHQPEFSGHSDLFVGMMNVSIEDRELSDLLKGSETLFKGKYLFALYSDEDLSRVSWTSQGHLARKVLIQKSHIFFSSNQGTIDFGLGKKHETIGDFKDEFKTLKPCIWSSDAHSFSSIFEPEQKRYTWIKADPTFEGLKQIVYEPEDRVKIQENKPEEKTPYLVIDKVRFFDMADNNLFSPDWIELNQNLNTIIGGKSSGKSLLLYHIAKGISPSYVRERIGLTPGGDYDDFSKEHEFNLEILWKNETVNNLELSEDENQGLITFIPQLYINHLAEEKGEKHLNELVEEILEQNSEYVEFRDIKTQTIETLKAQINGNIVSLLQFRKEVLQIIQESRRIGDIGSINIEIKRLEQLIDNLRQESGFNSHETELFEHYSNKKETLSGRRDSISSYGSSLSDLNTLIIKELEESSEVIHAAIEAKKIEDQDNLFLSKLQSEILTGLKSVSNDSTVEIARMKDKIQGILGEIDLRLLDAENELQPFFKRIKNQENLKVQLENLESEKKKKKAVEELMGQQKSIIEKGKAIKEAILKDYESLFIHYKEIRDELNKDNYRKIGDDIELLTELRFDTTEFRAFSNSFDGRTRFNTFFPAFDDNNEFIYQEVNHIPQINQIFDKLRELDKLVLRLKEEYTEEHLYTSLMADYFKFKYVIKHKGDDILKGMSPGKRGVVLLELILHLSNATHPILIDQPEDNLDNRTVYYDLKEFIKDKKIKRQIIIVTHNANLVVATDAENIIVANQDGQQIGKDNRKYRFEYVTGSLENTFHDANKSGILFKYGIREHVCDILEGGQEAFEKREEKYGFK